MSFDRLLETTFQEIFRNNPDSILNTNDISTVFSRFSDIPSSVPINTEPELESSSIPVIPSTIPTEPTRNIERDTLQNERWNQCFHFLENYHQQMTMYQENVRIMLQNTQTILGLNDLSESVPVSLLNSNTRPYSATRNNPRFFLNTRENQRDILYEYLNMVDLSFIPSFFANASIPTREEIENATEIIVYHRELFEIQNIQYTTCPISLEEFQEGEILMKIKYCGHIFKKSGLENWFSRNKHCPTCRHSIS